MRNRRILFLVIAGVAIAAVGALRYLARHSPTSNEIQSEAAAPASVEVPANPSVGTGGGESIALTPSEWTRRYANSTDYFQFVSEAAVAAQAGNGRAALLLIRALASCTLLKRQYGEEGDPQSAFDIDLANSPPVPQWVRDVQQQSFSRCRRFFKEDPFAQLPPRAGGYPIAYWRAIADASDDPLIKVQQAMNEADTWRNSRSAESRTRIQAALSYAIRSNDPEAMFNTGIFLSDAQISSDPLRGIAWTMLACQRGYDCSAQNPLDGMARCVETASCPVGADWTYILQRDLGADIYARAYALAQEMNELMARGDWSALEKYWTPDSVKVIDE